MAKKLQKKSITALQVLLVGNNPIELGLILEKLDAERSRKMVTEIAFNHKTIIDRLVQFKPDYILIDDNIGKAELAQSLSILNNHKNTKGVPITILKNTNYSEASTSLVLDYELKNNWSVDALFTALKNSFKLSKTPKDLLPA